MTGCSSGVANAREVHASLVSERSEAQGLLAELTGVPFERRRLLVFADPRFRSWGLCELLLTESGSGGRTIPAKPKTWRIWR